MVACGESDQQPPVRFPAAAGARGSAAEPPATPRSVEGTWAIVAGDMDATVVELDDSGSGHGCQAGWADAEADGGYAEELCGPVTGYVDGVDGDHVAFDLELTGFGGMHYSIEGTLSEDGERIGGVHTISAMGHDWRQPGAAVRYDRSVERGPYPLGEPWPSAARSLVDDQLMTETAQGQFQVGQRYRLKSAWTTLGGDLGNYLGTEIAIDAPTPDDVTFRAGPVPITTPDMPIALTAHYVSSALVEVVVQMPSGEAFTLLPAPPQP
jgi:hypothetical protein